MTTIGEVDKALLDRIVVYYAPHGTVVTEPRLEDQVLHVRIGTPSKPGSVPCSATLTDWDQFLSRHNG